MLWTWIKVLMCMCTLCIPCCRGEMENLPRRDVLQVLLNSSSYDPKIAPDYDEDHPTNVTVQVYIQSMDSLSEMSMDFSVVIFLRQIWRDVRLDYSEYSKVPFLELDQKVMNMIWVPDTFFSNEKKGSFHDVTVPNKLMHIQRNGTIFYSIRLSLTMTCQLNLYNYPMDEQTCYFYIESYGYTTENLVFHWHPDLPVDVPDLSLPQFTFSPQPITSICDKHYGGNHFTCLSAGISFSRNTGYYIAQIFLPSILIVMLSWVSFWLDLEATPARISLGVLTVLTMTTQSAGARASLPRVSYIKAIDVWMASCLVFVFASLLEFAYVNVMSRKKGRRGFVCSEKETAHHETEKEAVMNKTSEPEIAEIELIDYRRKARRADKLSRVIFPVSFIIFNIGFWVYYLKINKGNVIN